MCRGTPFIATKGGADGVTRPTQVAFAPLATFRRGLSTAFCQPHARSGHNRKFVHPLRHRGRESDSCSAGKQARAHGPRTRSYQTCDASQQSRRQTPCHNRSRKLRIQAYTICSRETAVAAVFLFEVANDCSIRPASRMPATTAERKFFSS